MPDRRLWVFATPAGHKGTHPGNSSAATSMQVRSATFSHWGVFITQQSGHPTAEDVTGTFFELTRPRDRDIGIIVRSREVREKEERGNASWIHFERTECITARSDAEIASIGRRCGKA